MSDRRVYDIIPRTHAEVKYIIGDRELLTKEAVKQSIQDALNEALDDTLLEEEIWIEYNVPKRSGDLQESLLKFLKRSVPPPGTAGELRGIRLVLGVGADIDYAKFVNRMPLSQVRHYNTWLEHSGKKAYSKGKPVLLNDQRAIGFYHDKMVEHGKERLVVNLAKAKYKLSSTSKITSRDLTKLQVT